MDSLTNKLNSLQSNQEKSILKMTLMNWLLYWTHQSFQEYNNELIIWILNLLVISKNNIKSIFSH